MLRFFAILIAGALLTACVASQPAPAAGAAPVYERTTAVAPDDGVIHEASKRFWVTRGAGDAAALAQQFTDDGILMIPGLADATGRAAVQELLKIRFNVARSRDFVVNRREIQMARDSAHELGWFAETLGPPSNANRMEGHYLLVWKRGADDVWRVQRYLYNFSGATPLEPPQG